ncbi:MAG: 2-oxoacid:ferredoxin oxidoreductase subunit beta [Ignavibacteria bacterium]|nr:MAG: 2-oxoacid:ferredoxin oxidoreductase subunit beta [Ignavibacteria bacterium]
MANNGEQETLKLTAKDYKSDQDVRWCPGCGDYSILAQVQRTLPDIIEKEKANVVWVSGIGCSSRIPYYINTYGFHGIHGRAPAIATGVKVANPELDVWVATGDGDLLSIGGNHFIHTCRRNVDLKILLFNNRIYGLTKGQYSPTSEKGKLTKTSPYGSVDYPFNPISLAIGSGATFVARAIDVSPKHLQEMLKRAGAHKGTAFLEIYQNCNIFNDGAFSLLTDKDTKDDNILYLEHDKPMVFGKDLDKGIKLDGAKPIIVDLTTSSFTKDDILVHDEFSEEPILAMILAHITDDPAFPTPIGVFRQIQRETYDAAISSQIDFVTEKRGKGDLKKALFGANTWEVN